MDYKKIEQLKQEYMDIQIPEELDFIVKNSIKQAKKKVKRKNVIKRAKTVSTSVAASVAILIVGINTSPVLAQNLSNLPIAGGIVRVLTFREYKVEEDNYSSDIKVPQIQGLENIELQNSLNEKYLNKSKALYDQFMEDMKELEESGGGHLGVESGYVVKTNTDEILSMGYFVVNTVGSSSTTFSYYTIDKEKQILITLPSLFKDDTYIDIISDNIKTQMKEQMKSDKDKFYQIESAKDGIGPFKKILKEQTFYINPQGKLVISFDKYEVTPGYMGIPEFIIPTEILSDVLVGNEYIK